MEESVVPFRNAAYSMRYLDSIQESDDEYGSD